MLNFHNQAAAWDVRRNGYDVEYFLAFGERVLEVSGFIEQVVVGDRVAVDGGLRRDEDTCHLVEAGVNVAAAMVGADRAILAVAKAELDRVVAAEEAR